MKICSKCKIEKPQSEFHKDDRHKDGLRSGCKVCQNKVQRKYNTTSRGKERLKKYKQTPKGKETRRKYKKTPRSKETQRKYKNSPRGKKVIKNINLKSKYDITIEDYNNMLESQDGVCAICGVDTPDSFHVDHCHRTKEIRGILCAHCNRGLGEFKDSTEILAKAIKYLCRRD